MASQGWRNPKKYGKIFVRMSFIENGEKQTGGIYAFHDTQYMYAQDERRIK